MLCKSCGSKDFVLDDTYGAQFCSSCGAVEDSNNYEHQFGGVAGPEGTFVRVGTSGAGTNYSYKERKLFQSESVISDITFRLDLTNDCTTKVKDMVDKVTASEFGLGEWFSVLVGACSCIVMRNTNRPLPISEVANVVGCDLYEMGKMISRVVQFLEIQLPEFDIIGMLERMIRNFSVFQGVDVDKLELMVQQGNFIIQCTIKWFLTTGRRPGPVAVAVLVFIGKLNGMLVKIEEAAKEAFLAVHTCKKRYSELLEVLVKVAQKLPWGKDVNVNNILKNAPFVLKYMEMKSRENNVGEKRKRIGNGDTSSSSFDMEELLGECLGDTLEYGAEWKMVATEHNSQHCTDERENPRILSLSELENLKISHDTLARMYTKFTTDASLMKLTEKGEPSHIAKRQKSQNWSNDSNLFMYNEWWSGRSELCKRLMMEEIAEKDVGLDVLPPSYIRGCQEVRRRKQKIRAAKTLISSIARQPNDKTNTSDADLEGENDASVSKPGNGRRKGRKTKGREPDWEDFIIEALLLHQVKEEEIEKGHYSTLLDLHVFNSGVV